MSAIPERFIWASKTIPTQQDSKILEIGCGSGILVDCLAQKVETGIIWAIDQSAPMFENAKKRNRSHIDHKKVIVQHTDFLHADLPESYFDGVVAFNVNFFWKAPKRELERISRILNSTGQLYIFHQSPYEIDIQAAKPIENRLTDHHFEVRKVYLKNLKPTSALCIVAKPNINIKL